MVIEQCTDIETLRALGKEWLQELCADEYGLDVDLDVIIRDLGSCRVTNEGTILTAREGNNIIGVIAVFAVPSYMGNQKIAVEKYWYARKGSHFVGPRLYTEAVKWAKENGCSHLITSGSKMASDRHDSICRFLEKTGARHFETSYIYKIGDV